MKKYLKKENVYRHIFFIVGVLILSLGLSLIIKSNFGTGSWDSVGVGLFNLLGLSVGMWMNLVSIILLFICGLLLKKVPRISTLATSVTVGLFLDVWMIILDFIKISSIFESISLFSFGIFTMGIGICTYLVSNLPPSCLDYFMICLSKRFNISLSKSRTISESIGFCLGLLLGGPIGIGTIIILFSVGPIVDFFLKYTNSLYFKLCNQR